MSGRSGYWSSVVAVLTGTVVAQSIPLLGSLLIARWYSPADFGVFSAWLGSVMLAVVIVTGRFEMALAIEPDGEPRRLAVISILVTVLCAVVLLCMSLFFAYEVSPSFFRAVPTSLVFALPIAAFFGALAQVWQSWAAAEGAYRNLSFMRITQSMAVTGIQLLIGYFNPAAESLAYSYIAGVFVGVSVSVKLIPLGALALSQRSAVKQFWVRHRRFPLFSLPADSVNTAASQLPLLIIAARFGADIAGMLALTMRTLGAPISLMGAAVLDVFKRHAAANFRERGECRSVYLRTLGVLVAGSVLASLVLTSSGEWLFSFAFGEQWREAGTIAIWLIPMFAFRFVASPLSYMVYIAEKQHVDLIWQIALLGMTVTALNLPTQYSSALMYYSAGYSVLYVIYLGMSYRFSLGKMT